MKYIVRYLHNQRGFISNGFNYKKYAKEMIKDLKKDKNISYIKLYKEI